MKQTVRDNSYDTGIHPDIVWMVYEKAVEKSFFRNNRFPRLERLDYCPVTDDDGCRIRLDLDCPTLRELKSPLLQHLKIRYPDPLHCGDTDRHIKIRTSPQENAKDIPDHSSKLTTDRTPDMNLLLDCPNLDVIGFSRVDVKTLEVRAPGLVRLEFHRFNAGSVNLICPNLQELGGRSSGVIQLNLVENEGQFEADKCVIISSTLQEFFWNSMLEDHILSGDDIQRLDSVRVKAGSLRIFCCYGVESFMKSLVMECPRLEQLVCTLWDLNVLRVNSTENQNIVRGNDLRSFDCSYTHLKDISIDAPQMTSITLENSSISVAEILCPLLGDLNCYSGDSNDEDDEPDNAICLTGLEYCTELKWLSCSLSLLGLLLTLREYLPTNLKIHILTDVVGKKLSLTHLPEDLRTKIVPGANFNTRTVSF